MHRPLFLVLPITFLAACATTPVAPDPERPPTLPASAQCLGDTSRIELPALPPGAVTGWAQVNYLLDGSGLPNSISVKQAAPAGMYEKFAIHVLERQRFKPNLMRECQDVFVFKVHR